MRVACAGYRDWALAIYDELARRTDHQFLIFRSKAQYDEGALRDFRPDLVLFYGWSWVVPPELVKELRCLMLHPSPLPKYRGGSPIQNQIIAGETMSAVTVFLLDDGLDTGPIVAQEPFSLAGGMHEILERMTRIGCDLTLRLLAEGLRPVPQREEDATVYKRRKPSQSEITIEEIQQQSARHLYDKIRMLQEPYPNAFVRTADGKRLAILDARIDDDA